MDEGPRATEWISSECHVDERRYRTRRHAPTVDQALAESVGMARRRHPNATRFEVSLGAHLGAKDQVLRYGTIRVVDAAVAHLSASFGDGWDVYNSGGTVVVERRALHAT